MSKKKSDLRGNLSKGIDAFINTGGNRRTDPEEKAPAEPQRENKESSASHSVDLTINLGAEERKTKRVQLLMKPSLHARVKELAGEYGISFNELVSQVLEQLTEGESGDE